jgi:hypothetical protein
MQHSSIACPPPSRQACSTMPSQRIQYAPHMPQEPTGSGAWKPLRLPHRMKWKHRGRGHAATLHEITTANSARAKHVFDAALRASSSGAAAAAPLDVRAAPVRTAHARLRFGCKRILLWHLGTAVAAAVCGSQQQAYHSSFRVALGAGERAGRIRSRHQQDVCRHRRPFPSTSSLLGKARLPWTASLVHIIITCQQRSQDSPFSLFTGLTLDRPFTLLTICSLRGAGTHPGTQGHKATAHSEMSRSCCASVHVAQSAQALPLQRAYTPDCHLAPIFLFFILRPSVPLPCLRVALALGPLQILKAPDTCSCQLQPRTVRTHWCTASGEPLCAGRC